MLLTALLISGSEVRALHGSPLFSITCGRLTGLPLFVCDQLVTIFSTTLLSVLRQDSYQSDPGHLCFQHLQNCFGKMLRACTAHRAWLRDLRVAAGRLRDVFYHA